MLLLTFGIVGMISSCSTNVMRRRLLGIGRETELRALYRKEIEEEQNGEGNDEFGDSGDLVNVEM